MSPFVNIHTKENVNAAGVGGQKSQPLVNVVCELPLTYLMNEETFVLIFNIYWTYFIDFGVNLQIYKIGSEK